MNALKAALVTVAILGGFHRANVCHASARPQYQSNFRLTCRTYVWSAAVSMLEAAKLLLRISALLGVPALVVAARLAVHRRGANRRDLAVARVRGQTRAIDW